MFAYIDYSAPRYYSGRSILLLVVLIFLAYLVSPLNSMRRQEREGLLVVYPAIILVYWFMFQFSLMSLDPGLIYYLGPTSVYVWTTNSYICLLSGAGFSLAILRSDNPKRRSYGRWFFALYILLMIAGRLFGPVEMST